MDYQYVDPALPRTSDGWRSPALGLDMPLVHYGHAGHPLLLFPTAAADCYECERFFLIKAVEPAIMAGRIRVISIESINRYAWMDRNLPPKEQARRQALYSGYLENELVPFIRNLVGHGQARIAVSGASFGAFHAANAYFRRPDLYDTLIAMSGFYDLGPDYLKGYSDDNCYYNNPTWFVPNLGGGYLDLLRTACRTIIVTGQGQWEAPECSRSFSRLLHDKGIPHALDLWGHDVAHDWPWWRKMLPYFVDKLWP
ncbi:MAG: esterase family protein [Gemmatimonadales bacterium]